MFVKMFIDIYANHLILDQKDIRNKWSIKKLCIQLRQQGHYYQSGVQFTSLNH
jgi:hypothetical protein